jgi:hypothetical protein
MLRARNGTLSGGLLAIPAMRRKERSGPGSLTSLEEFAAPAAASCAAPEPGDWGAAEAALALPGQHQKLLRKMERRQASRRSGGFIEGPSDTAATLVQGN